MNLDSLISEISRIGEIEPIPDVRGGWRIKQFEARIFDPPIVLFATTEGMAKFIESAADDAVEVFPDVSPDVGGYRLLFGNLSESLSRQSPPREIHITAQQLAFVDAEHEALHPEATYPKDGNLVWISAPRGKPMDALGPPSGRLERDDDR